MRLKLLLVIFGTLFLGGLLIASLLVVQQRQDIRQRAANDVEFMQVTPPTLKKGGKAQVAVVVNQLDPKFDYRLVFGLQYDENPEFPGQITRPPSIRKTREVKENKTYKFSFKADDCRYVAKLNVQLFYREKGKAWQPVDAPTAQGNVSLDVDCIQKWPSPPPAEPIASPTDASASAQPQPTPVSPSASPEIVQPDQGDLSDPDPEAEPIENLEDASVIEQESQQAAATSPTASPTNEPANLQTTPTPSPSGLTQLSANPTSSPNILFSPSPSPQSSPSSLALLTSSPSPESDLVNPTPTPSTVSGGFAALLDQPAGQVGTITTNPSQIPASSIISSPSIPSITSTSSDLPASESQPLVIASPSPQITAISVKSNVLTYVILAVAALGIAGLGVFLLK